MNSVTTDTSRRVVSGLWVESGKAVAARKGAVGVLQTRTRRSVRDSRAADLRKGDARRCADRLGPRHWRPQATVPSRRATGPGLSGLPSGEVLHGSARPLDAFVARSGRVDTGQWLLSDRWLALLMTGFLAAVVLGFGVVVAQYLALGV